MANATNSLWPSYIKSDVMSPATILKLQADALETQTKGVLCGEVYSEEVEGGNVRLMFDIRVPLLDDYRHRVLVVGYVKDFPYPAIVDAAVFRDEKDSFRVFLDKGWIGALMGKPVNRADNDEEFTAIVAKVLGSPQIGTAAQSLVSRVQEILGKDGGKEQVALDRKAEAIASAGPENEIQKSSQEAEDGAS